MKMLVAVFLAVALAGPAIAQQPSAGDKVKFEAQKLGGAFSVTRIEAVK